MKIALKLCNIMTVILALILLSSFILPSIALADDVTGTSTGALTLSATFECISVYASFSSDNNSNNSATLEYRAVGSSTWIQGMDMTVDRRATIHVPGIDLPNPYVNQWRASILGLTPNTSYDVRVTFNDVDGVSGTNPVTGTVTTRNDDFDSMCYTGDNYYVATTGNDTTGDGSIGNPFLTPQKGADAATSPGDTVYLRGGTYNTTVEIQMWNSGDATNYITLRNYPGETVIINSDGNGVVTSTAPDRVWGAGIHICAAYVRVLGIEQQGGYDSTATSGATKGIWIGVYTTGQENVVHDVVVEDCIFRDTKTLESEPSGYAAIYFGSYAESFSTNIYGITIQDNDIYLVEPGATVAGTQSGSGITMCRANAQNVIRRNNIYYSGTLLIHGMDGIVSSPNFSFAGTIQDTDIFDNTIEGATDDGISLDGNGCNVRVWNNTLNGCNMGISIAPVYIGPAYIFRNVLYDPENHWTGWCGFGKGGEDGTGNVYFYHNSFILDNLTNSPINYGLNNQAGGGNNSTNVTFKNNIIITDGPVLEDAIGLPTMDYDLLYNYLTTYAKRNYFGEWDDNTYGDHTKINTQNLDLFVAGSGQETHGVGIVPTFIDKAGKDFHLANGSAGINQGAVIYGFNDADSTWPYSGLTPDIGAYEYESGPSTPMPPDISAIGNKSGDEGQLLQFTISATDPNHDPLTYSADNLPSGASFNSGTHTFSWTPDYTQAGIYTNAHFEVTDGSLIDSEDITITVSDANGPPVLAAIGNKSINEGQLLTFIISATDPNNDPLTYSASNLPIGSSFDSTSHTFSWTPNSTQTGSYSSVRFEVSDNALTDFENITITVEATSPDSPSGGGGGGGGGGGSTGTTSVAASTTKSGRFVEDVTAESGDNKVKLNIPRDTIGLNQVGQYLHYISIKEKKPSPTPPPFSKIIGLVYEIGPYGTTFEPSVNLIFKYIDSELPGGVAEKNLVLAKYDSSTQQWQNLQSTVDADSNTVTIEMDRCSIYAILAYSRPSSFTVTELSIASPEVELGSDVVVSAVVTNTGDLTGSYTVNLKLDEGVVGIKEVTINGGDSETVSFNIRPETAGEHQASIGDTLGVFSVKKPPAPASFSTSNLVVSSGEITLGNSVSLNVLVTNTGDLRGNYIATLKVNNAETQTKEITLDGGVSEEVSFNITPIDAGQYQVDINGLSGTCEVKVPTPSLTPVSPEISSFSFTPKYDSSDIINSIQILYEINQPYTSFDNAKLALKVSLNGEPLETIPLLTLSQLQSDNKTGILNYTPSSGWVTGDYLFRVEMSEGNGPIQSMRQEKFTLMHESITKAVSWASLGMIIGITLVVGIIVVVIVLYCRRDTLKGY